MDDETLDCLIIGAGPGGLTAATYLVRFHRRIAVVDADRSRARWIPESHNCPGFPFGVAGPALLARLRAQAEGYGARIVSGRVTDLRREGGHFVARADNGGSWRARHVVLATGIVDRLPAIEGDPGADALHRDAAPAAAIADGTLRLCAVCDGYEASDDRLAVYAPVDDAIRHAVFLRTFSRRVDAIASEPGDPSPGCAALAREASVAVLPVPKRLRREKRQCVVEFDGGDSRHYDSLYPVLGAIAQSQLAVQLGARLDDRRELLVDDKQQTTVDRMYAIGDVVSALNQISVAVGHAAIAATAIHNRLPHNFREQRDRQPETAQRLPQPAPSYGGAPSEPGAPPA